MTRQRNAEVHWNGVELQETVLYIPITAIQTTHWGHPAYAAQWWAPPGTEPPKVGINIANFEIAGTGLEVVDTCREFVSVLETLVSGFEAAYPTE